MSERSLALQSVFPDVKILSPEQVAVCLKFAREHLIHLCVADPLPLKVLVRSKNVFVRVADLAVYLDRENPASSETEEPAPVSKSLQRFALTKQGAVDAIFRAELRFEIYRIESVQVFKTVANYIAESGRSTRSDENPISFEEQCKELWEMEALVLKGQVGALATQLVYLGVEITRVPASNAEQGVMEPERSPMHSEGRRH